VRTWVHLGTMWTEPDREPRPLGLHDIVVVAPFNAQVALIREHLSAAGLGEVRVGTVDKFQGRQAPVVIFSTASSTSSDAPRGVGFLLDSHRLNVAVSRARALAVVVGSPALLESPVGTPEQLRLVNALCRFVDLAESAGGEVDPRADDDADRGVA